MGIYEDWQIHTKTGFRPIKLQESRSGPHTNRTPSNNTLQNFTFMGTTVSEIAGWIPLDPPPLVNGVCTKRLSKGRVNITYTQQKMV